MTSNILKGVNSTFKFKKSVNKNKSVEIIQNLRTERKIV